MESIAIVTALVVAAAVVVISYVYASGTAPPSIATIINWITTTFQRGLNVLSGVVGQGPLFPAAHQMAGTAAPVAAGAAGAVEAGARSVQNIISDAEQAVADTVTPGAAAGGIGPAVGDAPLGAGVESSLGFCYVGQSADNERVCAQVPRESNCMSGEYYTSMEQCRLNTGARLGQRPSGPAKGGLASEIGALL